MEHALVRTAVLKFEGRERLWRRILHGAEFGEHRIARHHARNEEVERDRSDGRQQVEADTPHEDAHASHHPDSVSADRNARQVHATTSGIDARWRSTMSVNRRPLILMLRCWVS